MGGRGTVGQNNMWKGSQLKSKKAKGKEQAGLRPVFYMSLFRCGLFLLLTTCCLLPTVEGQTRDFTKWVNPFIGTGGHGHTFPGATMPFGMVQLSPDTRTDNWDGSSGYHYSDDIIYGFSHTHLSGTGIPDYCDILFTPVFMMGGVERPDEYRGPGLKFHHSNEQAGPGYYSVKLDSGIKAELTATQRVGLQRYTFPDGIGNGVMLDLKWRDKVLDRGNFVRMVGKNRIEGFRRSSSWAKDQVIYFVAEFSAPVTATLHAQDGHQFEGLNGRDAGIYGSDINVSVQLPSLDASNQIQIKVALSPVSIEGARKNLAAELLGWDFDKVRADAKAAWNKELSKIEVSGGTDAQTTTFYTALYHTMIQPNIFQDVDGSYLGHDKKIHNIANDGGDGAMQKPARQQGRNTQRPGYALPNGRASASRLLDSHSWQEYNAGKAGSSEYTVFSLWDTFRAAHPLYTIIDQKRTVDFINTFIRQYEQGGRLPVWELAGNETDCMIGYHSVSVIADAMAKGIKGFDYLKAYEAAKHSAELDRDGLAAYKKRGYISMEDENESVSKTLEYAYDDWCIAQMSSIMARRYEAWLQTTNKMLQSAEPERQYAADYQKYSARAGYFENLFDPETGFMRPKQNGGFVKPFAPNEVTFHFTEGNSWVYSFFVPQDIDRLMQLQGGEEKFAAKLDELFTTTDKLSGREQPDITGLIGQYAHGNEPSHHIAYLYDYAGQPWKTQKLVRKIMDEFYKPEPDGLIGNEDCGQMSAWYILSASGFYEVTPGSPIYAFGTPLFKEVKYNLENGRSFTIKAPNVSTANFYIKSANLNGQKYQKSYISHEDLMRGGVLEFEMTDSPATTAFVSAPQSGRAGRGVAVPVIEGGGRVFKDQTTITLKATSPHDEIIYSTGGKWNVYTGPFTINKTTTIKALTTAKVIPPIDGDFGIDRFEGGLTVEATFVKRPNDWTVKIASRYGRQYTGGGDEGLIDGIRGTVNFASGEWQGYQGQDLVATVDLQRETEIKKVGGGFLQVARSWIWMPTHIEFEVSSDNVNFTKVADIKTDIAVDDMDSKMRDYVQTISPVKARYVRVHAYNLGKIPAWHPGAGGNAYIFIDEIIIE